MMEFPASGIVSPSTNTQLFREVLDHRMTMGTQQLGIDTLRLVIVILILFYQVVFEFRYERRKTRASWRYFLGTQGLSDLGIICIYIALYSERYMRVWLGNHSGTQIVALSTDKYMGAMWRADIFKRGLVLEAFLLALLAWRLFAFMKVNRHVFLIWDSLNKALVKYVRFLLVLVPILAGFIVVAHAYWRAHSSEFRTFWSAGTSILMLLLGEDTIHHVGEVTRPGTLIFIVLFYFTIVLFFLNSWFAIVVQEYQTTRISAGFRPKEYAWSEYDYVSWFLPSLLKKLYCKIRPKIVPIDDDED
jgi:hypothetical protein